jgi:cytochrome c556
MRHKIRFFAFFLPLLLTACGEPADTHPGQPVTQRRMAFKEIINHFEPMGVQLRRGPFDATKFLTLARQLDQLKETPWSHFGADTNYPPTKAKAALWKEPEKFEASRQEFIKAVSALAVVAESGDKKQIATSYETLHETCRSCHEAFKE